MTTCRLIAVFFFIGTFTNSSKAQTNRMAAIGSSSVAGLATSHPDSSWVRRFSYYYKNTLGVADTVYNLGVSGSNIYRGMPGSYTAPAGRPAPDSAHNVTRAVKEYFGGKSCYY